MALHLARPKHRSLTNPSLLHLFSTSSNKDGNSPGNGPKEDDNPSSVSSYFSDVKASLKHQQQRERPTYPLSRIPVNPSVPSAKPISMSASLEEIRKNLTEFRCRSAVPPPTESSPTPSQSQPQFSFQDLYRRNVLAKQGESNEIPAASDPGERSPFASIKESLRQMKSNSGANDGNKRTGTFISLSDFRNTLKLKPYDGNVVSRVIGGSSTELPNSIFGREMKERTSEGEAAMPNLIFGREMKERTSEGEAAMKTEFVKIYSASELGEKLKQLRPERKEGEQWFSLRELNERLMKLREMEERETESRIRGISYSDLRGSLISIDEKQKKASCKFSTHFWISYVLHQLA